MKSYYRIMLGRGSQHAEACFSGGFIGADFEIHQDLAGHLPDNWRTFNAEFRDVFIRNRPGSSKIAAGLACGFLWTIAKGIRPGDTVLSPDGSGRYRVGEVTGEYIYKPGDVLPHRRPVTWSETYLNRADLSLELRRSAGSIGTVSNITRYADEIAKLIGTPAADAPAVVATDASIEDPTVFALESHLEEFLVHNWPHTELGKKYDLYTDEGEIVGQQYPSDTGPIDLLAISKDRKELLVVELKRGRASDTVVGQIQRYMGYVAEELAEEGQTVRGVIIALEDDLRIRRALRVAPNISFYRYQVSFRLFPA